MMSRYSGEYQYTGWHGCDCVCHLEIDGYTVVATELVKNKGTSITNFSERLATQVCNQFNIPKEQLTWIEHYPANFFRKSMWDLVTFDLVDGVLKNAQWRPLGETERLAILPRMICH